MQCIYRNCSIRDGIELSPDLPIDLGILHLVPRDHFFYHIARAERNAIGATHVRVKAVLTYNIEEYFM